MSTLDLCRCGHARYMHGLNGCQHHDPLPISDRRSKWRLKDRRRERRFRFCPCRHFQAL